MTVEFVAEAVGLVRTHRAGDGIIRSLDGVSIALTQAEVVAIMGPSGSGKSTLVHLLAGLDNPDEGVARVCGTDWSSLHGRERARFRRRSCGFVGQSLALLPQATAAENIEVPMLLDGRAAAQRGDRVVQLLDRVGLSGEGAKLPDQLSGGQQQRVAIARALAMGAPLILADEPTASLDSATAAVITRLLLDAAREQSSAVLLVTHDPSVAAQANRTVRMHSGRLESVHEGRLS